AHQAAVREQEDEVLRPDIEFSLCGQHMEMSIEQFVVHLDDQRSSDSLDPPLHRDDYLKSRIEPGVGDGDIFVLSSLIHDWQAVQPCTEHRTLWGGAFVTHIARTRGMVDMLQDLPTIEP
ncbi:hypothetical protein R6Q57_001749, partial [Mikania cordata]